MILFCHRNPESAVVLRDNVLQSAGIVLGPGVAGRVVVLVLLLQVALVLALLAVVLLAVGAAHHKALLVVGLLLHIGVVIMGGRSYDRASYPYLGEGVGPGTPGPLLALVKQQVAEQLNCLG